MARRSKPTTPRRDLLMIAKPLQGLPSGGLKTQSWPVLSQIEDRRSYHPLRSNRPAATLQAPAARHIMVSRPGFPGRLLFRAPAQVVVCVRRKIRKQVIHALRKAGRVGQRRPRFNRFSSVRC